MRKKINGLKTQEEYKGTLESVIGFLESNEQYGDDYTNEKQCLRDILVDYGYALNLANADNPTIDNVWDLQKEKKELEKEVKRLSSARTVFQTPWTKSEHLGKEYLYSYRIQFYEETLKEVEEWCGEDGWYTAYFMVSDHGTKELDGSIECWDADGGVHWPSEEQRASNWVHYCFPVDKSMAVYLKEMIE